MSIRCRCAQAVILSPNQVPSQPETTSGVRVIPPNDDKLNYHGRWDIHSTAAAAYWCRAYVRLTFTGSTFQLNLGSHPSVSSFQLCITMDGSEQHLTVMVGESIVYPHLQPGTHTITIMNVHHSEPLIFTDIGVSADSIVSKPKDKPVEIQFIGDMLTAMDTSYSTSICGSLDCEHTTIARGSIALRNGWGGYKLPSGQQSHIGMEKAYFHLEGVSQSAPYTPASYAYEHPNAILVNIGTNDWLINRQNCTLFIESYQMFIRNLRTLYPCVPFYLILPFADNALGLRLSAITAAAKSSLFDKNIRFVDTRSWGVEIGIDRMHPTVAGFDTASVRLCSLLREGM